MSMDRLLIALTVALGGGAAAADTTADPLRSPACRAALQDLQAREATLGASTATTARSAAAPASAARPRPGTAEARVRSASIDPDLQRLRDAAARACLASRLDAPAAPAPGRLAQPPVVVPSSAGVPRSPTSPTVPVPLESPRPAVPQTPPPAVVTTCDAAGCWTSDGRRLERVGPNMFVGPRGVCSAQGALLQCP
jgi:hypothetical protein